MDLKGDSLTLVGEQALLQTAANIYNQNLQGFYNIGVGENGLVSMVAVSGADMSTMTIQQQNQASTLDNIAIRL